MELILLVAYVYFGAMANSFLRHHVLKVQTAYVFNMQNFLMGRIIWAIILGWATIPLAIALKLFGVDKARD